MMNIAVFVSGGGTNLQALIDAQNRGEIKTAKSHLSLPQTMALMLSKEQKRRAYPLRLSAENHIHQKRSMTRQFLLNLTAKI